VDLIDAAFVLALLAVLRGVLLAVVVVAALRAKSAVRRKVALQIMRLLLTPSWRRSLDNREA
jgi:hypothetical protein